MIKSVTAKAPGKVILFGEHSVVYKQPAIAIAVSKFSQTKVYPDNSISSGEINLKAPDYNNETKIVYNPHNSNLKPGFGKLFHPVWIVLNQIIDKDIQSFLTEGLTIEISSNIPRGAGMGSSASLWVSCAKALSEAFDLNFTQEKISAIAFEAEKFVHGTPSGIDNSVCTFGGGILFENENIQPLKVPELTLIVGNTQKSRRTRGMVALVRHRHNFWPFYKEIISSMGSLVRNSLSYLRDGDINRIGELMDINHGLLVSLGVSSGGLNKFVDSACNAGALGAKLTGGGGGGCMIALCTPKTQESVSQAIKDNGGIPYLMQVSQLGAHVISP